MKLQMRIFWLLSLMVFTAGCSGYRVICYPGSEAPDGQDQDDREDCPIQSGDDVVLTLRDGEQVEGKVKYISAYEIILNPAGKSIQPRGYALDQVYSLESKSSGSSTATTFIGLTCGLLIVGGIIAYYETASLRDGFMGK